MKTLSTLVLTLFLVGGFYTTSLAQDGKDGGKGKGKACSSAQIYFNLNTAERSLVVLGKCDYRSTNKKEEFEAGEGVMKQIQKIREYYENGECDKAASLAKAAANGLRAKANAACKQAANNEEPLCDCKQLTSAANLLERTAECLAKCKD